MSTLAENAAAVKAAQVAVDAAIVAKGGTTAGGLSNAAAAINSMNYNYDADDGWIPPLNWPNIRKILADDVGPAQYPHKVIYFFERGLNVSVSLVGAKYYKLSTGTTFSSDTKLTGGSVPDEDFWVICYTDDKAFSDVLYCADGHGAYNRCGPSWVVYDGTVDQSILGSTAGKSFYANGYLKSIENLIALPESAYPITDGCDSLENVQNFKFSSDADDSLIHSLPPGFSSSTVYPQIKYMSGDGYAKCEIISVTSTAAPSWLNSRYNSIVSMPRNLKVTATGSATYTFSYCGNLKQLPDFSDTKFTATTNMFVSCVNLLEAPQMDLSHSTNCDAMFRACSKIKEFPDYDLSACTTNANMFAFCYNVEEIKLSHVNGVIGDSMFSNCLNLTRLDLPSEVTTIGSYVVNYDSKLKEFIIRAVTPPTLSYSTSLSSLPTTTKIYVPKGSGAAYKAAPTWIAKASQIYELDESGNIPEEAA